MSLKYKKRINCATFLRYNIFMKIKTISTFKELSKYLLFFILFYICAIARFSPTSLGLALGLYVALVYCRLNMLLLTPMYICATLLADVSVCGIIYALAPCVVMAVAKYAHFKRKKPMRIFACNAYALLTMLLCLLGCLVSHNWGNILLSALANQIFTYFAIISCYAALVRGASSKFSVDEIASVFVVIAAMSMGLYNISFFSFRPFYVILGFAIMYAIYAFDLSGAMILSLAIALGGSLAARSIALVGGVAVMCLISATFSKTNVWIVAGALILSDMLCGIFFGSFEGYNYLHIIAISFGSCSYAILPKKWKERLLIFSHKESGATQVQLGNRLKEQLSSRLSLVSSVFYELSGAYGAANKTELNPAAAVHQLSIEVMRATCHKCGKFKECASALGVPTSEIFDEIIYAAVDKQRATLVDLPNFINSHCINIQTLLYNCNSLTDSYLKKVHSNTTITKEQRFISEQFGGIGGILSELISSVKGEIIISGNAQEQIMRGLGYNNIVCNEVTISASGTNYEVSIIVRREDENKKSLVQVVSKIIGVNLIKEVDSVSIDSQRVCVFLVNKPRYDVVFHTAGKAKTSGEASGDRFAVERLRHNKTMLALCDGMGSGEGANQHSANTLKLISKFYKAGFDNTLSLSIINRLLAISSEDSFSALDMCVVDLSNGMCDFIKLGGVDSLIKKSDRCIKIKSEALPMGIVEEARPQVQRVKLDVGDTVIMCSDGISDSLTMAGLEFIVSKVSSLNPAVITSEIMGQAKLRGLGDDASIIAFRLFEG